MLFGKERVYEILVRDADRWVIDKVSNRRKVAMMRAHILLEEGKYDAVRITFQEEGRREEVIFDQECKRRGSAPLSIVPIEEANYCKTAEELHKFAARETIGRILRKHLDEEGLTPWEFVFDPQHIKKLMRMDRISDMAIQRIATLQARSKEEETKKRISTLYDLVKSAIEISENIELKQDYQAHIAADGLAPALKHINETVPETEKHLHIGASLSGYLSEQRDWPQKQGLIYDLLNRSADEDSLCYLDEINAEIIDSPQAGKDILGPQGELGSTIVAMGRIASGQFEGKRQNEALLVENCKWLTSGKLPLSTTAFNTRIANAIKSAQAFTREGLDGDRASFKKIISSLTQAGGLCGGPVIAAAVAIRARALLKEDQEDAPVADALSALMPMMPSEMVRTGFLLDLSCSDFGAKFRSVILQFLLKRLDLLKSIREMVPNTAFAVDIEQAIEDLTPRIHPSIHDHSVGEQVLPVLASLLATDDKKKPKAVAKADLPSNQKIFRQGDVIIKQGGRSQSIFMILSGEVDLHLVSDGKKNKIATVRRGDLIGEMAWIDDKPNMTTATVVSKECKVTIVARTVLKRKLEWLAEKDPMLHHIVKSLAKRMRGQTESYLKSKL